MSNSTTILHVRATTRTSPGAILDGAADPARAIATVPGLIWKVWILDEASAELGGVYLFASRAQAQAYVDGPILEHLRHDPRVLRVEHRFWDTHALSALTRAPEAVPVAKKEVA
jgi:Putative mono-oxygenase ydhR